MNYQDKSSFPKFLSVIFILQFIIFIILSIVDKDPSIMYWSILLVILGLILIFSNLTIKGNAQTITYKFSFLPRRQILIKEIENIEFTNTSQFLGVGINFSKKYGFSVITETNIAVCITMKDGKKITLSITDEFLFNEYIKEVL
ncbi:MULTISPECIES: hypothetical protein [Chryseobacterium]|uniref:hypothetical protein n=1 Tax=Chryseobacterium TaxID=59732 RepID=UPI000486D91C|nr:MULTISPECIES: hypothetical protein [Chryseobacterium]ASE63000.1 hypothetical protein CEQ15_16650 [Chryseobacterium indologenes]VFA42544.1 Uncharacterised protein [Chryseobacterium indologenes]